MQAIPFVCAPAGRCGPGEIKERIEAETLHITQHTPCHQSKKHSQIKDKGGREGRGHLIFFSSLSLIQQPLSISIHNHTFCTSFQFLKVADILFIHSIESTKHIFSNPQQERKGSTSDIRTLSLRYLCRPFWEEDRPAGQLRVAQKVALSIHPSLSGSVSNRHAYYSFPYVTNFLCMSLSRRQA